MKFTKTILTDLESINQLITDEQELDLKIESSMPAIKAHLIKMINTVIKTDYIPVAKKINLVMIKTKIDEIKINNDIVEIRISQEDYYEPTNSFNLSFTHLPSYKTYDGIFSIDCNNFTAEDEILDSEEIDNLEISVEQLEALYKDLSTGKLKQAFENEITDLIKIYQNQIENKQKFLDKYAKYCN